MSESENMPIKVGDAGALEVIDENIVKLCADPEIYKIIVPFENYSTSATNCYVIRDAGEVLIVDTGAPTDEACEVLVESLGKLGVDPHKASYFLTHFHLDHAGLVDRLVDRSMPLYLSYADFIHMVRARTVSYRNEVIERMGKENIADSHEEYTMRFGVGLDSFDEHGRNLHLMEEGDVIKVGTLELQVMLTAGHTPGHLSLYEPKSRSLFCGDHILFVISPGLALRPDFDNTLDTYISNLRRVQELAPVRLLYSHGRLRGDWNERIEWLIKHHLDRVEEAQGIIERAPGMFGKQIIQIIKWNVPYDNWEDIPVMQRWCILEEGIVFLDYLVNRGSIIREEDESGLYRYYASH